MSRRSRIIAAAQENSAEEEMRARQAGTVACDYILDVCPSLGVNQKTGEGMIALGNNAYVWVDSQRLETDCMHSEAMWF